MGKGKAQKEGWPKRFPIVEGGDVKHEEALALIEMTGAAAIDGIPEGVDLRRLTAAFQRLGLMRVDEGNAEMARPENLNLKQLCAARHQTEKWIREHMGEERGGPLLAELQDAMAMMRDIVAETLRKREEELEAVRENIAQLFKGVRAPGELVTPGQKLLAIVVGGDKAVLGWSQSDGIPNTVWKYKGIRGADGIIAGVQPVTVPGEMKMPAQVCLARVRLGEAKEAHMDDDREYDFPLIVEEAMPFDDILQFSKQVPPAFRDFEIMDPENRRHMHWGAKRAMIRDPETVLSCYDKVSVYPGKRALVIPRLNGGKVSIGNHCWSYEPTREQIPSGTLMDIVNMDEMEQVLQGVKPDEIQHLIVEIVSVDEVRVLEVITVEEAVRLRRHFFNYSPGEELADEGLLEQVVHPGDYLGIGDHLVVRRGHGVHFVDLGMRSWKFSNPHDPGGDDLTILGNAEFVNSEDFDLDKIRQSEHLIVEVVGFKEGMIRGEPHFYPRLKFVAQMSEAQWLDVEKQEVQALLDQAVPKDVWIQEGELGVVSWFSAGYMGVENQKWRKHVDEPPLKGFVSVRNQDLVHHDDCRHSMALYVVRFVPSSSVLYSPIDVEIVGVIPKHLRDMVPRIKNPDFGFDGPRFLDSMKRCVPIGETLKPGDEFVARVEWNFNNAIFPVGDDGWTLQLGDGETVELDRIPLAQNEDPGKTELWIVHLQVNHDGEPHLFLQEPIIYEEQESAIPDSKHPRRHADS